MKEYCLLLFFLFCIQFNVLGAYILIPMDNTQKNHLKSYGLSYWILENGLEVDWLLNYRGGSFVTNYQDFIEKECKIRGISYEVIANLKYSQILLNISKIEVNQDVVKLEKPPKIAVYSPKTKLPWDDAVTLALTYAEIPYDLIYDEEVLGGSLPLYDWLHLHHEDFTGQYGKFYSAYKNAEWYRKQKIDFEKSAKKNGIPKSFSNKA